VSRTVTDTCRVIPSARSGATFVHDESGDRLLLFGGLTDDGESAETWALGFGG